MIAHIDADAFFASALQRKYPRLLGKPLLALGMGGGCVIAASYEAKAYGVKTGMRMSEAKKLCPHAVSMPSDFDEALLASRQIEDVLKNTCPIVEQMSVDEWYLYIPSLVGGVPPSLLGWAKEVQEKVRAHTGLTVSLGVATSKLLAKMSSEYRKPAGTTVIGTEDIGIEEFLRNRPAAAIPGIGRRRSLHAESHNWQTAWDIATADPETIVHLFGKPGRDMQRELLGEMVESVSQDTRPPKSISRCRSFPKTMDTHMVFGQLLHHLTYTTLKMRRQNLSATHVAVWMRSGDYMHTSKDAKLPRPCNTEEQLLPYITACFKRLIGKNQKYTRVGLSLNNLVPTGNMQYSLFENVQKVNESEHMQQALDALHEKYGREAVKRGSALNVQANHKKKLSVIT